MIIMIIVRYGQKSAKPKRRNKSNEARATRYSDKKKSQVIEKDTRMLQVK